MSRANATCAGIACAALLLGCESHQWEPLDAQQDTVADVQMDSTADSEPPDTGVDTPPDGYPPDTELDPPEDTAIDPDSAPPTCVPGDLVGQGMCGTWWKCTFMEVDGLGNPITFCDVAGTQGMYETCTFTAASDDCQAGYKCANVNGDYRCRRFCNSDGVCSMDPGGPDAACALTMNVSGVSVSGVTLCSIHCTPLDYPSGCPGFQACKVFLDTDRWFTDCRPPGYGDECETTGVDDCPRGWGCFYHEGSNQCLEYCGWPWGEPECTSPEICNGGPAGFPYWVGLCY